MISNFQGITLLGLGPGDPGQITRQAWDWLNQISEVYLRTGQHPTVAGLPSGLKVRTFDDLYDSADTFEQVYEQIVEQILALGRQSLQDHSSQNQGVTYAVPGHPLIAEATGPEIARRARAEGIPVRVIEGISFLEPVYSALELDPFPHTALVDAFQLISLHHPPFPTDKPALVAQIYSREVASEVKLTLNAVYPDTHAVRLVHAAGTDRMVVEDLALYEIDRSDHIGLLTVLYLPALGEGTSLEAFQEIIARLRAPDGCPWDREQTHRTLRKHLLEETYEALTALDEDDSQGMKEEFGDLLLQICLHAQIGSEDGEFTIDDIVQSIYAKIIRRHPHVFGETKVDGVSGVLQNWEKLKEAERKANGTDHVKGLLDGVPAALPALSQAQEVQDRARRVGFDWPDIEPVIAKVLEELDEVRTAPDEASRAGELGDLLFAVVNVVRWYKVDAESALRETTARFRRRFSFIEHKAREQGRTAADLTFEEMDAFWEQAKDQE